MAFGKGKTKEAPVPLTTPQLIAKHQQLAERLLDKASQAGRLEAETRFATMATAHATLAVSYLLAPPTDNVLVESAEDIEVI